MKQTKSTINIRITIGEKSLSLNLSPVGIIPRKYYLKRGRTPSEKLPIVSITQVCNEIRKFIVARESDR